MQAIGNNYKSISVLLRLNADRIVMATILLSSLWIGAFVALI